jgi:7-cyano-7-deazaguanine synthase in queuosine biosynthesis
VKSCILFSGGFDCIAAVIKIKKYSIHNYGDIPEPDLLFFNYSQTYFENELNTAKKFAKEIGMNLVVKEINLEHDQERRNFYFIAEAKRLGYQTIITGNRNIHPLFDKYKDSNYFSIKKFAKLMNVEVILPVLAWPKRKVVNYIKRNNIKTIPYNCYNNSTDFINCNCPNCKELRKIQYY